jgi:hypothetical protein
MMERSAQTDGRLDACLPPVFVSQRNQTADDVVVPRECVEHLMERNLQIQRAGERPAGFEQRREALLFVRRFVV